MARSNALLRIFASPRLDPRRKTREDPQDRGPAPNGGAGGSTQVVPIPPTLDYEMWCGPAAVKPYTADRCHPPGTYWIYDYSIGYLAGWGAHPLDIMVWISDWDTVGADDGRRDRCDPDGRPLRYGV